MSTQYKHPESKEDFAQAIEREQAKLVHLRLVTAASPVPAQNREPLEKAPRHPSLMEVYRSGGYAPEVITYATALLWGAWVANPFFSVFTHGGVIYDGPRAYGPEALWGGFVLLAGVMGSLGLLSRRNSLRSAATSMLMSVWAWGFIAAISGPSLWTTAPVAYPVLAWVAAWAHSLLGCLDHR